MNRTIDAPSQIAARRAAATASFLPAARLSGRVDVPSDKSISHRSAIFAAMASGKSAIRNYLDSEDSRSTLDAIQKLGARVEGLRRHAGGLDFDVHGVGLRGPKSAAIYVGNASTPQSLLTGWLAGQLDGTWRFDGDDSLRGRPVRRLVEPLSRMGANITCDEGCHPPFTIAGSPLHGTRTLLDTASAQVKSCLMLAGLVATGKTYVQERHPARDHTEQMLNWLGIPVSIGMSPEFGRLPNGVPVPSFRTVCVDPVEEIPPAQFDVPRDISSAAFFLAGAAVIRGSNVELPRVGHNPTRTGFLDILKRMGADLAVENASIGPGGEPVADLTLRQRPLRGTVVSPDEVPRAIDELPLVALVGCFAEGETVVTHAMELRRKESDRISTVVTGLKALGADIEELEDGFRVVGRPLTGGHLSSHRDHRLAMMGAIAGLASRDGVEVDDMAVAEISYRGFEQDLQKLLA